MLWAVWLGVGLCAAWWLASFLVLVLCVVCGGLVFGVVWCGLCVAAAGRVVVFFVLRHLLPGL